MTNAGYEIMNMVYTGKIHGVALGWNGKKDGWVTWEFDEDAEGIYDFYWGHYADSEKYAREEFCIRIAEIFEKKAEIYKDKAEWERNPKF